MISTTKVLCFVAIAFADSDFQTDHDAVMRELSGGEPEGLDTIEEFRELVGDTEEFRELVGDTEEFRELADASAEVRELVGDTDEFRELADAIADEDERETGLKGKVFRKVVKLAKKLGKKVRHHRQLDEDAEERETGLKGKVLRKVVKVAKKLGKRVRQHRQSRKHRQLDGDNAPVLV